MGSKGSKQPKRAPEIKPLKNRSYSIHHFWTCSLLLQDHLPKELIILILQLINPKIPSFRSQYTYDKTLISGNSQFLGLTTHHDQIFVLNSPDTLIDLSSVEQTRMKLKIPPNQTDSVLISTITDATGIAVVGDDKFVITDPDRHGLHFFDFSGNLLETHRSAKISEGVFADTKFDCPWGVSISSYDGRIAVSEASAERVQIFDPQFNLLFAFQSGSSPVGVGFQSNGNIIVADNNSARAMIHDATGCLLTTFANTGAGTVSYPQFVFVDGDDKIGICDWNGKRVAVYNPKGEYLFQVSVDLHPRGLTLTQNGDLVVSCYDPNMQHCVKLFVGS